MSESAPLLRRADEEAAADEYDDEDWSMSPKTRNTLFGIGGFFSVVLLWFFIVFLPGQFIPEKQELTSLVKVDSLNMRLTPINAKTAFPAHGEGAHLDPARRLVMVGDIHGHYIQLRKLLRKLKFDRRSDRLLVLGDFITKGPDSLKVLDFLIDNRVDCILGNHELYVLQYYSSFHGISFPGFVNSSSPVNALGDFNSDPEFLLAKKLQPRHVQYINSCSIIKKLGPVPHHKKPSTSEMLRGVSSVDTVAGVAVHGGLRWDLTLEQQNPVEDLEMRSLIAPYYNQSTDDPSVDGAVSWSKIWNIKQKELKTRDAVSIYYGHDARRGLNLKKFSKGLDSGCDSGGQLSAVVVWDEVVAGAVVHREQLQQVKC